MNIRKNIPAIIVAAFIILIIVINLWLKYLAGVALFGEDHWWFILGLK